MIESQKLRYPSKRRLVITSLVFTVIACGLVCYLFGAAGPISKYLDIDLGFLILPFLGYYLLRLASRLTGGLFHSRDGLIVAVVLNGAAFAFFGFCFFRRFDLFAGIPALADSQGVLAEVTRIAPFAITFFVGFTILKLSALLAASRWERRMSRGVAALGYVIMGLCLWQVPALFTDYWSAAGKIGLVFFAGMLGAAAANFGYYGRLINNRIAADSLTWLRSSPVSKFFIAALAATYIVFIEPAIASVTPYAHIITWLIVCFVAWRIFSEIQKSLQNKYTLPHKETDWERHVQLVDDRVDDEFNRLELLQADFIEESHSGGLLEYLKQLLHENKLSEPEAGRLLRPLAEYQDRKAPWYALGLWRKRFSGQNKQNRRQALASLVASLNNLNQNRGRKV